MAYSSPSSIIKLLLLFNHFEIAHWYHFFCSDYWYIWIHICLVFYCFLLVTTFSVSFVSSPFHCFSIIFVIKHFIRFNHLPCCRISTTTVWCFYFLYCFSCICNRNKFILNDVVLFHRWIKYLITKYCYYSSFLATNTLLPFHFSVTIVSIK